ncbi:MAG TPA: lipopolysaccharide transport periplasmic protein LptA [Xanthomonadales bacterium]
MLLINRPFAKQARVCLYLFLLSLSLPLMALESDRQEPLEVSANSTDGTLGDGITTLRGNVDIRQGTLRITADEAEVNKVEGKVSRVTFRGRPAFLEQEIEEQGLVQATANTIDYQVASGIVTLSGNADVKHPQYQISGELLTYDLNIQHFQGSSDKDGNGRIHILLDPEVISSESDKKDKKNGAGVDQPDPDSNTPASDTKDSGKDGN